MATIKRKVTLRTKEPDAPIQVAPKETTIPQSTVSNESKKSKKLLWIALTLLIVVLGFCAYLLINKKNTKDVCVEKKECVEQSLVVTPNEGEQSDEATSINEESVSDDAMAEPAEGQSVPEDVVEESVEGPDAPEQQTEVPVKTNSQNLFDENTQQPNKVVPNGSLDDKARQVIRGNFGNGAERRQKLGDEYVAIQNRVNEMYREGIQ